MAFRIFQRGVRSVRQSWTYFASVMLFPIITALYAFARQPPVEAWTGTLAVAVASITVGLLVVSNDYRRRRELMDPM